MTLNKDVEKRRQSEIMRFDMYIKLVYTEASI